MTIGKLRESMTVGELIEKLQEYPEHYDVIVKLDVWDDDIVFESIHDVRRTENEDDNAVVAIEI